MVSLCVIEGYFSKMPKPAETKPLAQALRAGLAKRRYQVKGARPAVVRAGVVYYLTVREEEKPERAPLIRNSNH